MTAVPVAYVVNSDYNESSEIVFATRRGRIRALSSVAGNISDGEIGGLTMRRIPWADHYGASQLIPAKVLVAHGWWMECTQCGDKIEHDRLVDDGQDPDDVRGNFYTAYCSSRCVDRAEIYRFMKNETARRFCDTVEDFLCRRVGPVRVPTSGADLWIDRHSPTLVRSGWGTFTTTHADISATWKFGHSSSVYGPPNLTVHVHPDKVADFQEYKALYGESW